MARPGNHEGPKKSDLRRYYGQGPHKFIPVIQKVRDHMMRARAQEYLALLPPSVQKPRVLDVGCAEGRLLKAFLEKGCECWGVEHPAYPEERFLLADRITYLKGDLGDLDLPAEVFDLIFLWHVLEHMDEPDGVLGHVCRLSARQGAIVLAVPNFASLESQRFKGNWFHLDVPWHQCHFSENSLGYLFKKNHLEISGVSSLCLEQGPYGLIQSVLNAMGWPRNEFYEALKGHRVSGRSLRLLIQCALAGILAMPGLLATLLTSYDQKGPVLKMILRKK